MEQRGQSTHEDDQKVQTKMEESDKRMKEMTIVLQCLMKESHAMEEATYEGKREIENKRKGELKKSTPQVDPCIDHIE